MSTLSQIFSDRDSAGARYLAAVIELRAAYVDLASIEQAMVHPKLVLNGIPPTTGSSQLVGVQTFPGGNAAATQAVALRHAKYAPDVSGNLSAEVAAATNTILANFTPDE